MGREAEASGEGAGSETGRSEDRGRRFAAFISYSHADKEAAAKLQRRLERYRLPKHLAIERADGAAAIGRIFRDREDLAAAPSLSEAIRDAIARADALIVVCSPDACASRWVSEEITLFRTLHPDRPILAALVGGDHSTAFPEALTQRGTEPLAADLRKDGDGQTLGFLKIVAGIAGVPLDALVQRDAQRRVRRVTWITAGALAAMLVMGVMTTLAIQARNEAARQRAEAEGLVEYMLTDLREKLKGVGRFDVLDAVNERAMKHYQRQGDLNALPADSLERRARVLHAMGEDYEKRDKLSLAREKFVEAHHYTKALLDREPDNMQRVFAHGQSEYWVGRAAERAQDWPTAMSHYQAYADAAKRLIAVDPENSDYMMEMGWGHLNIGIVQLLSRQKPDYGEKFFLMASEWMQKAASARPSNLAIQKEVGNTYAWLADARYLLGDYAKSLNARQQELAAMRQIAKNSPDSADAKFDVAKAEYAVAVNLTKLNRSGEAKPLLLVAQKQMRQLVALEPSNREWGVVSTEIDSLISQGEHNAIRNR